MTAIEAAVRKQEAAEAVRILQVWRTAGGWRGDWMDLRKPTQPFHEGGGGTCRQIAFLVQDLEEVGPAAGQEILHLAPGPTGGVRVWSRVPPDGPTLYTRTPGEAA